VYLGAKRRYINTLPFLFPYIAPVDHVKHTWHRVKIGTYIQCGSIRNLVINVCAWHKISFKNGIIKLMLRDLQKVMVVYSEIKIYSHFTSGSNK